MRYILLLLLVGCMDSSVSSEVHTVVYQFTDVKIGDVVPETNFTWTQADADVVLQMLRGVGTKIAKHNVRNCFHNREKHLYECLAARRHFLLLLKDERIRELQILGRY